MDGIYVDSSVVLAFLLGDAGGGSFKRVRAHRVPILASSFLQAEVYAAMRREELEPALADAALALFTWILPDRPLTPELRRVLAAGSLRGADAWHIACALRIAPDAEGLGFITLDASQRAVAAELGFRVTLPARSSRQRRR